MTLISGQVIPEGCIMKEIIEVSIDGFGVIFFKNFFLVNNLVKSSKINAICSNCQVSSRVWRSLI